MGRMEEKRRRNTGDAGMLTRSPPTPRLQRCDGTQFRSVTVCVQRKQGAEHVTITGLRRVLYMGQQECQEKDGEHEELSDCKHEV